MSIHFIATLAQHVENDINYHTREKQYMYALSRIFSYNFPVYGVVSEISGNIDFIPTHFYPFSGLLQIPSTKEVFGQTTKSQKEFYSIQALLNNISLDDNSWIIKVSGRYMIYNDNFINIVKNCNNTIKAVIKKCDNDTQMYTFLFALRFKYFKDFFTKYTLTNQFNLEKIILVYIESIFKEKEILNIDQLGVICDIANCNVFTYF